MLGIDIGNEVCVCCFPCSGRSGNAVKLWDQDMKKCKNFQLSTGNKMDVVKSVCRAKVSSDSERFLQITCSDACFQYLFLILAVCLDAY